MIRSVVFAGSTPLEAKGNATHFLSGKRVLAVIEHGTTSLEFRKGTHIVPPDLQGFLATSGIGNELYVIMAFYDE
jgi:hypothetical protein